MAAEGNASRRLRLAHRVAVVTGATGGLGEVIARRFAAEGAAVILNGRRVTRGESIVSELRSAGADAVFVAGDVGDERTAAELAEVAERRHGRIDVLVLNAGGSAYGGFREATPEEFDSLMRTNVRGVWLCARAADPVLSDGASIVVMASVSSFVTDPSEILYCMTKAAVMPLVRGMARDLADRQIRVNALCPGAIGGVGMTADLSIGPIDRSADLKAMLAATPLGRLGTPEEVADGAVFLASSQSSFMTGTSLVLDGGMMS
jgi:NAD(P)-dependent dehydrogenase (short-subunit alcohol dehydrogenase family)